MSGILEAGQCGVEMEIEKGRVVCTMKGWRRISTGVCRQYGGLAMKRTHTLHMHISGSRDSRAVGGKKAEKSEGKTGHLTYN